MRHYKKKGFFMMNYDIRLREEDIPTKWFNAFPTFGVEIPDPMNSEGKNQIQNMSNIKRYHLINDILDIYQ